MTTIQLFHSQAGDNDDWWYLMSRKDGSQFVRHRWHYRDGGKRRSVIGDEQLELAEVLAGKGPIEVAMRLRSQLTKG